MKIGVLNIGACFGFRASNVETPLTSGNATNAFAVWAPSGVRVAYRSVRNGSSFILAKSANGVGEEEVLLDPSAPDYVFPDVVTDWSRDGRHILFSAVGSNNRNHVFVLSMATHRKVEAVTRGDSNEAQGHFSPDMKWVAFSSDESGKPEIYVQSFPDPSSGGKWIISNGGGTQPHWRSDGNELYYLSGEDKIAAVSITTKPTFKPGLPTVLFETRVYGGADRRRHRWDVMPDGTKFLINTETELSLIPSPITVVLNWQANLKK